VAKFTNDEYADTQVAFMMGMSGLHQGNNSVSIQDGSNSPDVFVTVHCSMRKAGAFTKPAHTYCGKHTKCAESRGSV
jgi:hypothetical protein